MRATRGRTIRSTSPNRACASSASTNASHEPVGRQRVEAVLPPQVEDCAATRPPVEARLDPADEAIAEQERQDVVAPATLRGRDVDLPDVVEVVQRAQEVAVPDERVERREERDARRRRPRGSPCAVRRSACEEVDLLGEDEAVARGRPRPRPGRARRPRRARRAARCGAGSGRDPAIDSAVPSHSSALPARPSRPWAR